MNKEEFLLSIPDSISLTEALSDVALIFTKVSIMYRKKSQADLEKYICFHKGLKWGVYKHEDKYFLVNIGQSKFLGIESKVILLKVTEVLTDDPDDSHLEKGSIKGNTFLQKTSDSEKLFLQTITEYDSKQEAVKAEELVKQITAKRKAEERIRKKTREEEVIRKKDELEKKIIGAGTFSVLDIRKVINNYSSIEAAEEQFEEILEELNTLESTQALQKKEREAAEEERRKAAEAAEEERRKAVEAAAEKRRKEREIANERKRKYDEAVEKERKKAEEAIREKYKLLANQSGLVNDQFWFEFRHRKIILGMPIGMVQEIKGPGHDRKRSVTKDGEQIKEKYGKYFKTLSSGVKSTKPSYNLQVEYEKNDNNIWVVTGYKDL